jgi:hypothetical protein
MSPCNRATIVIIYIIVIQFMLSLQSIWLNLTIPWSGTLRRTHCHARGTSLAPHRLIPYRSGLLQATHCFTGIAVSPCDIRSETWLELQALKPTTSAALATSPSRMMRVAMAARACHMCATRGWHMCQCFPRSCAVSVAGVWAITRCVGDRAPAETLSVSTSFVRRDVDGRMRACCNSEKALLHPPPASLSVVFRNRVKPVRFAQYFYPSFVICGQANLVCSETHATCTAPVVPCRPAGTRQQPAHCWLSDRVSRTFGA